MKTWIKNIAFSIGLFALLYLGFSFANMEFNAKIWNEMMRGTMLYVWIIGSAIYMMFKDNYHG